MPSRPAPGVLALDFDWDLGEDGWKDGVDENWLKLSVLSQAVVLSRTTNLPGSPTNGQIYIIPDGQANEHQIAVRDEDAWILIPPTEGWTAYVLDDNENVQFDGTEWVAFAGGEGGGDPDSGEINVFSRGTISSGTVTPEPSDSQIQTATNGGAHTLAPPTETGYYILTYTNNASAGAITTSSWDVVIDPDGALSHTVNGSIIEVAALNDGITSRLQATLLVDAT